MKGVLSVSLVLLLALGLVGLSTSLCRELMAKDFQLRAAASCHDDSCCNACLVDQSDNPAKLGKAAGEFTSTATGLLFVPASARAIHARSTRTAPGRLQHDLLISGEVYLLNASFLN